MRLAYIIYSCESRLRNRHTNVTSSQIGQSSRHCTPRPIATSPVFRSHQHCPLEGDSQDPRHMFTASYARLSSGVSVTPLPNYGHSDFLHQTSIQYLGRLHQALGSLTSNEEFSHLFQKLINETSAVHTLIRRPYP